MDKEFLGADAYEFYRKFKEFQSSGRVVEVVFGKHNKKITVSDGNVLLSYIGDDTPKLAKRIYRNVSIRDEQNG